MSEPGKDKEGSYSLNSSTPFMSMGPASNLKPINNTSTLFQNLFTPQSASPIEKSSIDNFTGSPSPGIFFPLNPTPKKEADLHTKISHQNKGVFDSLQLSQNPDFSSKSPGILNPQSSLNSSSNFIFESPFVSSPSKNSINLESPSKTSFSISDQSSSIFRVQQEKKDDLSIQSNFVGSPQLLESFKKKSDIISILKEKEDEVKAIISKMKNDERNIENMIEEKKTLITQQKSLKDIKTKQIDEIKKQIQIISGQIEVITKHNSELKAKSDSIIIEYGPFSPQFIDYSKVPQSLQLELKKTEAKLFEQRKVLKEKEKELFSNLNAKYNHYCNKIEKIRTNLAIHEKSLVKHNKFYGFHRLCKNAFEELQIPVLDEDEENETESRSQILEINEKHNKFPVFELLTLRNLGVFLFGIILSLLALYLQ
ncbi:hypothetical protein SteCoe_30360 [Stentor coeruleus]|uniref:Uncharacterized protein n=1 Tax=Stentor coeruleus TaxID=5963 RepID=A0A1R2B3V3_9CILI|nr:hypothetical protein SteCoe_30360 [Stentor coeruleus]